LAGANRELLATEFIVQEGFELLFDLTTKAKNGERFDYWAANPG
jgi:hypothetical protein